MNNSRPQDERAPDPDARKEAEESDKQQPAAADIQPEPTGGNRGSPAAPVMKQFQKTKTETSGRS